MPETQVSFRQILDHSHIANPYPLYSGFRETPVAIQEDGTYVISTYDDIVSLLHDPRVSSDERKSTRASEMMARAQQQQTSTAPGAPQQPPQQPPEPPFIFQDPPNHDRLRRLVMSQFTPERIEGMRAHIEQVLKEQIDTFRDKGQIDIVDDLAYPLPVTVICQLLGVPREDEARFHTWAEALATVLDPSQITTDEQRQQIMEYGKQMREYMEGLLRSLQQHPDNGMLSGLMTATDPEGALTGEELIGTAILLLIAGHETTVNLITNGMLTLLRNPSVLDQLRQDPDLVIDLVEELLRYDPPVHFRTRTTLADIELHGITIPKGASLVLLLASGSHDEHHFAHAEQFIADRPNNDHLGFGSGIHYCVGAPLARMEAQIALADLSRLVNPRLADANPPYRPNAALRGPRHLLVDIDGIRD
jgi:cytochrome P450